MRLPLVALTVASFHGCAPPMLHESDVLWSPAQDHMGENIGTPPTEVLLVEIKDRIPPRM
ncbi:MAG: hypothetical protein ABIY55_25435 [Kofleriaceae bacterium]